MRLTTFLLLISALHVSAGSYSQQVTLTAKKISLQKAFSLIQQQTGYSFFCDLELLEKAPLISLKLKGAPLKDALDSCLKHTGFAYEIQGKLIYIKARKENAVPVESLYTAPPLTDISIKVTGEKGQPLLGAYIRLKGTNRGTVTDEKGEATLKGVNNTDAVLEISFVGYQSQSVTLKGKTLVAVSLKVDVNDLGEAGVQVMNTGYQSIAKERATGSFDLITNKTLNQQVGTNILNRLNGVSSSVLFDNRYSASNNSTNLSIRGLSTLSSQLSAPLIILNNFPYDGDINNINPADVQDISILKDAAATSIWGARAGNGVIVITTKKGYQNQPIRMEINSGIQVGSKPDLFYSPNFIHSTDFIDIEKWLFSKGFYTGFENTTNHSALSPVVELLIATRDGRLSATDATAQINELRNVDVRQQYTDYMYQHPVNQQYSINLKGGGQTISYYLSAGYDRNTNELTAKYNRLSLRNENSYYITRQLTVTAGISYNSSLSQSGKPAYNSILLTSGAGSLTYPYMQFADKSGQPLAVALNYRTTFTDTAGGGKFLDWNYYPLLDYQHDITTNHQQDLLANLGVQYQLLSHWNASIKYQYERQQLTTTQLQDEQSYYTRDLINRFTQLNRSTGAISYPVPLGGIFDKAVYLTEAQNVRGQLDYTRQWTNHSIIAIAGSEIRSLHSTGQSQRLYGYDDINLTYANADVVNPYKSNVTGSNEYMPNGVSLSDQLNHFVSFYSNAAYTYRDRYSISASVRKDESNLFGVRANDKGVPLWSSGFSWILSKEKFYHTAFLPFLKLRVTYGFSGNVDQSKSAVTTFRYYPPYIYTNLPYAGVNQYPNPDLQWEKVRMINVGLDFSAAHELLTGSLEIYQKKGTGLFGNAPLDYTAGLGRQYLTRNVAAMSGKGIDFTLNAKVTDRQFKWNINWLVSYNAAITTNYYQSSVLASSFLSNGISITPIQGKPLYTVASYHWGGLSSGGDPQGFLNGKLSTDYASITSLTTGNDLEYKEAMPKVFGNMIHTFTWKGVSVSANLLYRLGYYFRKTSINYGKCVL
jgi:TonB-linked SusC/RagA family outer membrane protein